MRRLFLPLFMVAALAITAHADTRPSLQVSFKNLGVARAGVPMAAEVEIRSPEARTLKSFDFAMRGTTVSHDAPLDSLVLPANTPHTLHLNVVPSNNDDELVLQFMSGGFKYVFKRNLSQFWSDLRNYGQTVGFDPQPEPPSPALVESGALQSAPLIERPLKSTSLYGRPVMTYEAAVRQAGQLGAQAAETQHLLGRIRYERPDNTKDHVDGAIYTIWLKAPGVDVPVANGITDPAGRFDETVVTLPAWGRTFYVTFQTTNAWVHVLNNDDSDDPYAFKSAQFSGQVGGGTIYPSFLVAANGAATPALHMLTTVTRAFRFVLNESNYTYPGDIDDLDISWPESDWPHYTWPVYETMYIPDGGWEWATRTFMHEFGHHVNWELPITCNQTDYSDGNCESPGDDGRHCRWCGEDDLNVATMEGFASWYGDMVASKYQSNYGVVVFEDTTDIFNEWVAPNGMQTPCPGGWNGDRTEGYYWALLRDLADDHNEADPNYGANQSSLPALRTDPQDKLSLGFAAVLDLLVDTDCNIVQDFKTAFFNRYGGVLPAADIWDTFSNAGYWYDTTAPGKVTNLHSTDHSTSVSSPDNSLTFAWDPATDSQSGIQKYQVWLYNGSGGQVAIGPSDLSTPTVTFSDLAPDDYFCRVAAVDRAGNVKNALADRAVSPTYTIRAPYPTDLAKWLRTGWDEYIAARSTTGATSGSAPITAYLPGSKDSTWFTWAVDNLGEIPVTSTFRSRLLIDGVVVDSVQSSISGITFNPLDNHTVLNRGPFNIRPGRHTVEVWTDAEEEIAEPSETNNRFGMQYVWEPASNVTRGADIVGAAPPDRDGGFNSISVPLVGVKPYNCVSYKFTHNSNFFPVTTTQWAATEMWAEHGPGRVASDYELMLDLQDRDPYYGFVGGLISSARGAGLTQAVITNATGSGNTSWETGVVNRNNGRGDFHYRVNLAGNITVGDTFTVTLEANQMVAIRSMTVTSGQVGKLSVELKRIAGTSPLKLSYLNSTTNWATLASALGDIPTTDDHATLSFNAGVSGNYPLIVWRDPSQGTGPVTVTLRTFVKPSDLAIVTPTGWDAPVIPRPGNDATNALALRPAILYGDDKPTWLSISKRNNSDVASGFNNHQVRADDQVVYQAPFSPLAALTTYPNANIASVIVPGGRHVLSQLLDPSGVLPELSELNNTYAEQYVWTPDTVAADAANWRKGQIGGVTAGWEYCLPGDYLYFNMDGVRIPQWGVASGVDVAAVMLSPRDTADVDMGLYLAANDAKQGFDVPQEDSNWGPGQNELVVINFALAKRKAYDVGIQRVSDDTTSYLVDVVTGVTRDPNQPVHGPFTLGASRLVQVHRFVLPIGRHTFHLRNLAGSVDWGMSLYDSDRPFQDRTQGEERGWSYQNGTGADEEIVFVAPHPITVALVVYKTQSSETAKSGTYQLELGSNPTDAGDTPPSFSTRLAAAYPNPFRGTSALSFEMAREGELSLEVYDLRGARVRTLARGTHPAGRHSLTWDGRDDTGRPLPAGLYMVRMTAEGYQGRMKLVRME